MIDSGARETRFVVRDEDDGTRLDVMLASFLPQISRSQLQRLIRSGHVSINGKPGRTGALVKTGGEIRVSLPALAPATPQAEDLPLHVLYEDSAIAVIDKPAGMVVHPGAGHARRTLVNALLYHLSGLSGIGGQERPGIVHRLDRGTSGLMVIAKHDRAHRALSDQFQARTVTKEYIALVWGAAKPTETITTSIGRDPLNRRKMSSRAPRGRRAVTQVVSVERLRGLSLVRLVIGTGRTHQIRVHLSEAGHPVVGDELYGGARRKVAADLAVVSRLERPFLHAARLVFAHPEDGRLMSFESPLPEDLATVLSALRAKAANA